VADILEESEFFEIGLVDVVTDLEPQVHWQLLNKVV
jgi:hypothetical protein